MLFVILELRHYRYASLRDASLRYASLRYASIQDGLATEDKDAWMDVN